MSSPATAAFLTAWRSAQKRPAVLLKLALTNPTAQTLYLATEAIFTPDGTLWEAAIAADPAPTPIHAPGDFLAPGPDLASFDCYLVKKKLGFQASGRTSFTLPADFQLYGATATVYLWEQSLTNFSDALQVFAGTIDRYAMTPYGLQLFFLQGIAWNVLAPSKLVGRAEFPNCPDASLSKVKPFAIGDFRSPAMRSPWTSAYGVDKEHHENVGGTGLWCPGIVVDRGGSGANTLKILFADHSVDSNLGVANTGECQYILNADFGSKVQESVVTPIYTGEASVLVDDDAALCLTPAIPVDIRTAGFHPTTATDNPRNAFDIGPQMNEVSAARMDQAAGKSVLSYHLPSMSSLGQIIDVTACVGYSTDTSGGGGDTGLQLLSIDASNSTVAATIALMPSITTPQTVDGAYSSTLYTGWDFTTRSGGGAGDVMALNIEFNGGANQKASIYFVALWVHYRPSQELTAARNTTVNNFFSGGSPWLNSLFRDAASKAFPQAPNDPPSLWATNLQGIPDDGSGTYTGTIGAQIEKTADAARWLLCNYGGLSPTSDFETGASTFGSFVGDRTAVVTDQGTNLIHSLHGGRLQRISDWLRILASDTLKQMFLDRFDNKWRIVPWNTTMGVTYDLTFAHDDACPMLAELMIEQTSDVDVRTAVRVKYGYEPATQKYLYDTFVNPNGEDPGAADASGSDLPITIDATNDKWVFGNVSYNKLASCAHGTYPPIDAANAWTTAFNTAFGTGTNNWRLGWGFDVKANFNDRLTYHLTWGGSSTGLFADHDIILPAGHYTTGQAFADMVANQFNRDSGAYVTCSCTYDSTTNEFTLTFNPTVFGNAQGVTGVTLDATGPVSSPGTGYDGIAWPTLGIAIGFTYALTGALPWTKAGTQVRKPRTFHISFSGTGGQVDMSGTHTVTGVATNAATNMGWAGTDKTGLGSTLADNIRGDWRSADAGTTGWDEKGELVLYAESVRAWQVAVNLRNRYFDLTSTTRMKVTFKTRMCPDMQRGRVIQFDSSIDAICAYPKALSDGSWAGKRFRVMDVQQQLAGEFWTQVVAIEC